MLFLLKEHIYNIYLSMASIQPIVPTTLTPSPVRRQREEDDVNSQTRLLPPAEGHKAPKPSMELDMENWHPEAKLTPAQEPRDVDNIFIEHMKQVDKKKKKDKQESKAKEEEISKTKKEDTVAAEAKPKMSARDAALRDFGDETAYLHDFQRQYDHHMADLRTAYLDETSQFMREETPRIANAIANEQYGDIIEDAEFVKQIQERARMHVEAIAIKYRSARGLTHQRNEAAMLMDVREKQIQTLGKQLLSLLATLGDLLRLATEKNDALARTTYMMEVSPQWALKYDMLQDKVEEWILSNRVVELLDGVIKNFKEMSTKQKIKHEVEALELAESGEDDDDDSSEDDEEDEESDDDDDDETADESGSEAGDDAN